MTVMHEKQNMQAKATQCGKCHTKYSDWNKRYEQGVRVYTCFDMADSEEILEKVDKIKQR